MLYTPAPPIFNIIYRLLILLTTSLVSLFLLCHPLLSLNLPCPVTPPSPIFLLCSHVIFQRNNKLACKVMGKPQLLLLTAPDLVMAGRGCFSPLMSGSTIKSCFSRREQQLHISSFCALPFKSLTPPVLLLLTVLAFTSTKGLGGQC